jgi:hypothetical protein
VRDASKHPSTCVVIQWVGFRADVFPDSSLTGQLGGAVRAA